jgi:hypothetical protein
MSSKYVPPHKRQSLSTIKTEGVLKPLIISLGIDCGPKLLIKDKAKIFQETLPFDWSITYKGVSSIIENGYKNLLNNPIPSIDDESYNDVENGIKFKHDGKFCKNKDCSNFTYIPDTSKEKTLDEVKQKYIRRLDRLKDYLYKYNASTNNQQIIFIRKSHDEIHHIDSSHYGIVIKNDIDDSIELEKFLSKEYPTLNYLIVVFLICEECFDFDNHNDIDKLLLANSSKIKLHYIEKTKTTKSIRMSVNDYVVKKTHLRTNPQMFDKILYCYTDKIKEEKKITINMCGGFKKLKNRKNIKNIKTKKTKKIKTNLHNKKKTKITKRR